MNIHSTKFVLAIYFISTASQALQLHEPPTEKKSKVRTEDPRDVCRPYIVTDRKRTHPLIGSEEVNEDWEPSQNHFLETPDGRTQVVADFSGTSFAIVDVSSGRVLAQRHRGDSVQLQGLQAGRFLVWTDAAKKITIADLHERPLKTTSLDGAFPPQKPTSTKLGVSTTFVAQSDLYDAVVAFDVLAPEKKMKLQIDSPGEVGFSSDEKYLIAKGKRSIAILELATGKHFTVPSDFAFGAGTEIDSGSSRLVRVGNSLELTDLQTHRTRFVPLSEPLIGENVYVKPLPDGRSFAVNTSTGAKVFDLSGKVRKLDKSENAWPMAAPNGKHIFTVSASGGAKVFGLSDLQPIAELKGEFRSSKPVSHGVKSGIQGQNGALIVSGDNPSKATKFEGTSFVALSPTLDRVLAEDKGERARLLDDHGRVIQTYEIPKRQIADRFSPDGRWLVNDAAPVRMYDARSGAEVQWGKGVRSIVFDRDGTLNLMRGLYLEPAEAVCLDPRVSISEKTSNPVSTRLLAELDASGLCKVRFDEKQWEPFSPDVLSLDEPTALLYLRRFQKIGGFDPKRHLSIAHAILRSNLTKDHSADIRQMLVSIFYSSSILFEQFAAEFPQMALNLETPTSCSTPEERSQLVQAAGNYVAQQIKAIGIRSKFSDWENLRRIKSILAQLPESDKLNYLLHISESLANSAADTTELSGVFVSKLYKLAYQAVAPLFGLKGKEVTDLTFVREADRLRPILLGVSPIDSDEVGTRTDFGFYAKPLPEIRLPTPANATPGPLEVHLGKTANQISWLHGKKMMTADIDLSVERDEIHDDDYTKQFPHDQLWKGGLNGVIIAGTNLRDYAVPTLQQYQQYYSEHGFEFEPEGQTADVPAMLKHLTTSGEMDYFVKEAHSDGDERNLFRLDETARFLKGTKQHSDGSKESVRLFFPANGGTKSKLLSNNEFGSWIREREKIKAGPLVYFNASCWSVPKAINELDAANSSALIDIPSSTMCYTFANNEKNGMRQLIDGFRKKGSYNEIRSALSKVPGYTERKTDVYLLPDEPEFESRISKVRRLPLRINVVTRDSSGNVVSIDEAR